MDMKLKKLIVVRHADFNAGEEIGASQSQELADCLKPIVGDMSTVILTSTIERAWYTAKILCRAFGLRRFTLSDILWWTTREHQSKAPDSLKLIEQHKDDAEIMVIVTHADYIAWLPSAFAEKFLETNVASWDLGYARGWAIDCELKTIEKIYPA